jgi:hypothetical protein
MGAAFGELADDEPHPASVVAVSTSAETTAQPRVPDLCIVRSFQ